MSQNESKSRKYVQTIFFDKNITLKYQFLRYRELTVLNMPGINISTSFFSLHRFYFSIREHNNIVLCSLDHERRVTLLLDTMKLCSDKIFRTFCEVLKSVKMRHVLEKLERKCPSLGKRKSAPGTQFYDRNEYSELGFFHH